MQFFASLLTSFIGLFLLGANAQECDRLKVRPNIHTMSNNAWNRYVNAIKQVNPSRHSNYWDRLSQMHVDNYSQVHSSPMFLAWHRQYLFDLESKLREIDPEVRIPYWDWSVHYNDIHNDPVWQRFGKNSDPRRGNCVSGGLFEGMSVQYGNGRLSNGQRCYTRKTSFKKVISGSKNELNDLIDTRSDIDFWRDFEYGSHGSVHNEIGGDFSSGYSPSDPLFYAHHAFIDKIWFDRQSRHSDRTLSYPASARSNLPGYPGRQVYHVLDPFNLCYTYLENNFSWSNVRMQSALPRPKAEEFIHLQLAPSIVSVNQTEIDEKINEHAKKYLEKDIFAPGLENGPQQGENGCDFELMFPTMDIQFMRMMKYDEKEVRQTQRIRAKALSERNLRCAGKL